MASCGWTEPGKVRPCNLMTQDGSVYCPRHTFLYNVKQQEAAAKKAAEPVAVAPKTYDGVPRTRRELFEQGYKFTGSGTCRGCKRHIEWWKTPKDKPAPYNSMPEAESPAVSHFATCERSTDFRRSA